MSLVVFKISLLVEDSISVGKLCSLLGNANKTKIERKLRKVKCRKEFNSNISPEFFG